MNIYEAAYKGMQIAAKNHNIGLCSQCGSDVRVPWSNLCEDCYFNSAICATDGDYTVDVMGNFYINGETWIKKNNAWVCIHSIVD